jgi:hypothetical protein
MSFNPFSKPRWIVCGATTPSVGRESPVMSETKPATPKQMLVMGTIAAAAGVYFLLLGAGLLPIPGGPSNLHGPLWIALCVGLAFFLAGGALFMQVIGHANASGDLPADAPQWMRVIQYVMGVAIFAAFAVIGSWVAFGSGERELSGSFLFFDAQTNDTIGRAAFGIGAIISWLCTIGFAVVGARKLLGRGRQSP